MSNRQEYDPGTPSYKMVRRERRFGGVALGVALLAITAAVSESAPVDASPRTALQQNDAGIQRGVSTQRGEIVPPELDDIAMMCALFASCDQVPIPSLLTSGGLSKCVKMMADELASPTAIKMSLTVRECGLRANSCSQLRACALRGASPDACVGRGKNDVVGLCDLDGRAISCFHEQVVGVRDCPRGGEQCIVRDGHVSCALGACLDPTDGGATSAKPSCSKSGTRVLQCDNGKLVSIDCEALGLRCAVGPDGTAGCAPMTAPCTGSLQGPSATSTRCEQNVSVGCVHGREVRIDCGAAGMRCSSEANAVSIGSCAVPSSDGGKSCDPNSPARCDGSTIKYCLGGMSRSFLCKTIGFSKCTSDAHGARCVNGANLH